MGFGRRGQNTTLNSRVWYPNIWISVRLETLIVPRRQRFFMLVEKVMKQEPGVAVGDIVTVTVVRANDGNS